MNTYVQLLQLLLMLQQLRLIIVSFWIKSFRKGRSTLNSVWIQSFLKWKQTFSQLLFVFINIYKFVSVVLIDLQLIESEYLK